MNIKTLLVIALITAIFAAGSTFATDTKDDGNELILGIGSFISPVALFKRMSPLRDYLSRELNQDVIIELSKNGAQLIKRANTGRYDLLFIPSHMAIHAFDSGLYVPGVIPEHLTTAALLVLSSSPINSVEQLERKVVATTQENGALALMASKLFRENGFMPNDMPTLVNYASQNAAFMAVQNGDVDAAFIGEFVIRDMESKSAWTKSAPVKRIVSTKPFPGISLIISSRLSKDVREKIIASILKLDKSDEGQIVLKKISFPAFKRSSIEEFDVIRRYIESKPSGKKVGAILPK